MKANKIFRWIWRLDAVLIFFVGLSVFGILAFIAVSALRENFRSHNQDTVRVRTQEGAVLKLKLSYGKFTKIEGTNFLVAPLCSEQEYSNFGYASSKEQTNFAVRNYLFLNVNDQSNHWLMSNNEVLFISDVMLTIENRKPKEGEDLPIAAIYYQIVKTDSNNDGRLDSKDKRAIAFSDTDGGNFTELISDIEEILSEERSADDSLLFVYKANGNTFAATVKISERKVSSAKELPKI